MKRILMLTALVMAAACRVAAIDNNTAPDVTAARAKEAFYEAAGR